jgi:UDP-N-acetylmuramoylalanine--D-glutamate ligase
VSGPATGRTVVVGYGKTGRAAARWLAEHGHDVTVVEDDREAAPAPAGELDLGGRTAALEVAPGRARAEALGASAALVVPSPGVNQKHPLVAAALASGVPVSSEVELAWAEVERRRATARCTLVGVTGTNGKTTVVELVAAMLKSSGKNAVAAGNVGFPLLLAASDIAPGDDTVLVAELSSFQLAFTHKLRLDVACWLNFSPDHLDWHPSLEHYAAAKARVFANQGPGCTAVFNMDDPVVAAAARSVPAGTRLVAFGASPSGTPALAGALRTAPDDREGAGAPERRADWAFGPAGVKGPGGFHLPAGALARSLPHDLANVAAACAVATAAGASLAGCAEAARRMAPPPHRVQFVAEAAGVSWYDDSKATTPASVLAAVRGFGSVVLVAGGRNKGLDLTVLATSVPPVRSVVAIGEAASAIGKAFKGLVPVQCAASMEEAVELAAGIAEPGDAVVLSPGCASFDWYRSYAERGDHFSSIVKARSGSNVTARLAGSGGATEPAGLAAPCGPAEGARAR